MSQLPTNVAEKFCLFTKYLLTVSYFMPGNRAVTKTNMKIYIRNLLYLQKCLKPYKNENDWEGGRCKREEIWGYMYMYN